MKNVLAVCLAALLLAVFGALPVFAEGEVPPKLEITEEMMKEAKPAGDAIKITIAEEPKVEMKWEKYLYVDVDQDLNEDQQTLWTRVGLRKGDFDFSVGWTQKFNEQDVASQDEGIVSVSFSIWW